MMYDTQSVSRFGLSRRRLLAGGGAIVAAATIAGCDSLSTEPDRDSGGSSGGTDVKEAPSLADRVAAGELPALAKRLPDEPLVVEPVERVGQYGGEWKTVLFGPADEPWLGRTIGYDQLMRWDVDFTEPTMNLAESVEATDDGRTYVIQLRAGLKWSDGKPYTAADLMFWYDDVLLNDEYPNMGVPDELTTGQELVPATFEKVDDRTVRISFAEPNGLFVPYLASGGSFAGGPRHYLKDFLPAYNPDVDQLASDEGFASWIELFDAKSNSWGNAELPTLTPWMIVQPLGESGRVTAERNPYYWKVDPDGRQLPYIDRVVFDIVNDEQSILLKATNGELDMHMRHINNLTNKPVLARSRTDGDYKFFDLIRSTTNLAMISFNLTHKDETLREIFNNVDFRIGLSHAINRDELIAAAYQRQGEAWQIAPRRESEFFNEELAKQYTEYDPDEANRRLDSAGYTARDEDDFRLGPDGKPIRFVVEVSTGVELSWIDVLELIKGYWAAVGIDMRIAAEDRSLLFERKEANDHDAAVWFGSAGLKDAMLDPRCYLPTSGSGSDYAVAWANWFNNSDAPTEEPPEAVKQQLELYRELKGTVDRDRQVEIFAEILEIAREQFYAIGTVLPVGDYGIVKNNVHNVPAKIVETGGQYPSPGPSNPEQYFISE